MLICPDFICQAAASKLHRRAAIVVERLVAILKPRGQSWCRFRWIHHSADPLGEMGCGNADIPSQK